MDETIVVVSHIRARPGYEAIVLDSLNKLIEPSRAEDGCLEYRFFQSATEPTLFVSVQIWASEKHLKMHGETVHMCGFRRVAPTVLDGPPSYTKWKAMG
jgi:quinol monooxygenase YgiN